jgi:hypothetical protein
MTTIWPLTSNKYIDYNIEELYSLSKKEAL